MSETHKTMQTEEIGRLEQETSILMSSGLSEVTRLQREKSVVVNGRMYDIAQVVTSYEDKDDPDKSETVAPPASFGTIALDAWFDQQFTPSSEGQLLVNRTDWREDEMIAIHRGTIDGPSSGRFKGTVIIPAREGDFPTQGTTNGCLFDPLTEQVVWFDHTDYVQRWDEVTKWLLSQLSNPDSVDLERTVYTQDAHYAWNVFPKELKKRVRSTGAAVSEAERFWVRDLAEQTEVQGFGLKLLVPYEHGEFQPLLVEAVNGVVEAQYPFQSEDSFDPYESQPDLIPSILAAVQRAIQLIQV